MNDSIYKGYQRELIIMGMGVLVSTMRFKTRGSVYQLTVPDSEGTQISLVGLRLEGCFSGSRTKIHQKMLKIPAQGGSPHTEGGPLK